MGSSRQELEKILGGKIESLHEQGLPGLVPAPGEEVVYFADDPEAELGDQMQRLITHVVPLRAKTGAVLATKHTLALPDGQLFHAIKYRGDVDGWRTQIAEGAKLLGVVLGKIEAGSSFLLSDGRRISLAEARHGFL